jgi:DNA-directed RNA polymerase specialized sigma24 family protein
MSHPENDRPHQPSSRIESLFQRLLPEAQRLARQSINGQDFRHFDEDDIAVSACAKLYCELLRGSVVGDSDSDQLRLLAVIVRQKVVDMLRMTKAAKRGGGRVRGESAFEALSDVSRQVGIDGVADCQPHGMLAAMERQNLDLLINDLPTEDLRRIALYKLEGYSNAEIARELGVCERTIERKSRMIRRRWAKKVQK